MDFSSCFFQGKRPEKVHQRIPCEIHPGLCSEKFPSNFCRSLFLISEGLDQWRYELPLSGCQRTAIPTAIDPNPPLKSPLNDVSCHAKRKLAAHRALSSAALVSRWIFESCSSRWQQIHIRHTHTPDAWPRRRTDECAGAKLSSREPWRRKAWQRRKRYRERERDRDKRDLEREGQTDRERDRERERDIYIYTYVYRYIESEWERRGETT